MMMTHHLNNPLLHVSLVEQSPSCVLCHSVISRRRAFLMPLNSLCLPSKDHPCKLIHINTWQALLVV